MGQTRFIVAGNFIDGTGIDVRRNVFLAIKDSIITAIGPAADLPCKDGAAIDDLKHCTIVPALVDCSVSLSRSPSMDRKVRLSFEKAGLAKKSALAARHIGYCLSHGVLGVAESDDSIGLVEHIQEVMDHGSIIDIRSAGSDFLRIVYSGNLYDGEAKNPRLNREDLWSTLQQRGNKKAVVAAVRCHRAGIRYGPRQSP
jgi:hypothetical protein